jgi:DNA-binding transcriptional MocR family regulator
MDEMGIRQSLSALARKNGTHLLEYGNPLGYLPLREQFAQMLSELGIAARASQIVLTQGTSQALDLIIRHFVKPGDAVLVDDPGYYNLFGNLRLHGARLVGVPRNPDGPDLAALEQLASEQKPRIYFTQSVMQNPTGTDMSPHVSFRVLQLAERFDFLVVEDDIFCDLQIRKTPRLAALDQLNRVIYARSFSKTLSGSLRVGFFGSASADRRGASQARNSSNGCSTRCWLTDIIGNFSRACKRASRRRVSRWRMHSSGSVCSCSSSPRRACSCGPGFPMSGTR